MSFQSVIKPIEEQLSHLKARESDCVDEVERFARLAAEKRQTLAELRAEMRMAEKAIALLSGKAHAAPTERRRRRAAPPTHSLDVESGVIYEAAMKASNRQVSTAVAIARCLGVDQDALVRLSARSKSTVHTYTPARARGVLGERFAELVDEVRESLTATPKQAEAQVRPPDAPLQNGSRPPIARIVMETARALECEAADVLQGRPESVRGMAVYAANLVGHSNEAIAQHFRISVAHVLSDITDVRLRAKAGTAKGAPAPLNEAKKILKAAGWKGADL